MTSPPRRRVALVSLLTCSEPAGPGRRTSRVRASWHEPDRAPAQADSRRISGTTGAPLTRPGPPARGSPAAFPEALACGKRARRVTALSAVAVLGHTPHPTKSQSLGLSHRGHPEPRPSLGVPSLPAADSTNSCEAAGGLASSQVPGTASCLPRPGAVAPRRGPPAAPRRLPQHLPTAPSAPHCPQPPPSAS